MTPTPRAGAADARLHELQLQIAELQAQNKALRQTQAGLQAAHDRYAELFASAPLAYLTLGERGLIEDINEAGARLLGDRREALVRRPLAAYIASADRERWNTHWLGALQGSQAPGCELALRRDDGQAAFVRIETAGIVCDARFPSLRVMISDITGRHRDELALRESESLLYAMSENLDQVYFKAAPDYSRFHFISAAADRIWGRPRAQLFDDPWKWLDWLHPHDRERIVRLLRESRRKPKYSDEFRIVWPDGEVRWMAAHAFLLADPAGGDYVIGYQTDITEHKRVEAQLTRAKQIAENASNGKTRFLAAASHDLRQPIQAINLFNDALARTGLNEQQQKIAGYLSQSVHSLSDLLNALLDISRLDAGAVQVAPRAVAVDELFARIDAECLPATPQADLRIKFFFPPGDLAITADISLLVSLLGKLIDNALKFTPSGGVLIALRRRGKEALIQVWDTGIGIAREHIERIFDDYFQVANAARDKSKGLGLGLPVARRIAVLLRSEISCCSRPGQGSVFSFRLPLAAAATQKKALSGEKAPPRPATELIGQHVVVVEDDRVVAEALRQSLDSLGMTVSVFEKAEDALADPQIGAADVYISDFRLPGINGLEFLDALQQRSAERIRAIVLTGDTSPERIALTHSSAWTVLYKPVHLPRLQAAIEALELPR